MSQVLPLLPEVYVSHLVSPRGVGDLPDAHAVGEAGSVVGGLGVRFTLTYRDVGGGQAEVAQIRGRALGSARAVAPVSWIVEHAAGARVSALEVLDAQTVIGGLCGHGADAGRGESDASALPMRVRLGAEMAIKALRSALGLPGTAPSRKDGPGLLVCRCLGVGDLEIRRAIDAGAQTPEDVGLRTAACTGCRSCRTDICQIIDECQHLPVPRPPATRHALERIVLSRGKEMLRALGTTLEDVALRGADVAVRVRASEGETHDYIELGALALIRHLLRETASDDVRVVPLNGQTP